MFLIQRCPITTFRLNEVGIVVNETYWLMPFIYYECTQSRAVCFAPFIASRSERNCIRISLHSTQSCVFELTRSGQHIAFIWRWPRIGQLLRRRRIISKAKTITWTFCLHLHVRWLKRWCAQALDKIQTIIVQRFCIQTFAWCIKTFCVVVNSRNINN